MSRGPIYADHRRYDATTTHIHVLLYFTVYPACSFHLASVQRLGLQTVLLATRSSLRVT